MDETIKKEEEVNSDQHEATGSVGWSTRNKEPEIIAAVKEKTKNVISYAWALVLVFPIGFLIAALLFKTMILAAGLITGIVLGIVMLGLNRYYLKSRRSRIWEGVITEKFQREKSEADEEGFDDDTDYVLVAERNNGKKHSMIYHNRPELYDYFQIGDRVRYHVGLSSYEKYDKSKDHVIFCNVCLAENPISNDRCEVCNNPLFK